MIRTPAQLQEALTHVEGEWILMAEMVALLPTNGYRETQDTAAMEATLIHARCLINFSCGGYTGKRHAGDIQPSDFLGVDWWPRDESFDRQLRGRLQFINEELQHLSWQRVLNTQALWVPMTLLVHEVHYGMHLFVEELRAKGSTWLRTFESQELYVRQKLPALKAPLQTAPHLAPQRGNPMPPA